MNFSNTLSWIAILLLGVAVGFLAFLYLDLRGKYVYVDSVKLANGYVGMKDAKKEFEAKATVWQKNLDSLKIEFDAKVNQYQSAGQKLSDKEKKLWNDVINAKRDQFLSYEQAISEKVKKEDQELTSRVVSSINEYVKRYGKENGLLIIMAATQTGNIIYADDEADITDEILKGLNSEYQIK